MRGGSSKTRIETENHDYLAHWLCGMRGGSSKTRIETKVKSPANYQTRLYERRFQ